MRVPRFDVRPSRERAQRTASRAARRRRAAPRAHAVHSSMVMASHGTTIARRGWVEAAARAGYTAKGVVYLMIGGLAVAAATGQRGRLGGGETAVRAIGDQSYGRVLLALTAAGL